MKAKNKDLLIIFTRNPVPGKCKTRLAASVGDEAALEIYLFLLRHTVAVTTPLNADKRVYYSDSMGVNDLWDEEVYSKHVQEGADLGQRMARAFKNGFSDGYKNIIIIGSDLFDLNTEDLNKAFEALKKSDYVLGPAQDGGYYLLGMKHFKSELFENKAWGSSRVLEQTLADLKEEACILLPPKNDVDVLEDILDNPAFLPFIKDKI
ncbi:hypothetical protein SAMN06265375_10180 [Muriicola jejuensis]|uniref:DUF2064 domain-containing protein n=1 Tax=Muriicola jejuensis TaxID=504488 RepID=A0A6P0UBH7_9FLAO|nr:TIGR04282 family arsenosugar biosynthesis glycosyltransferase [Muriicola jejuensis]NER10377.1 DUF2064 domain-containing protein [Muriicola jejuensis]SMP00999.1 hypothetical protein SAMN06265375_10180 [Muriicola jejuensis]